MADDVGNQNRFLNLADPYRFASGDDSAGSPGNWVDGSDGYSHQELNTRATVHGVRALGMEPQPFITEAFVSHAVRPTRIPNKGATGGWYPHGPQDVATLGNPPVAPQFDIWSDENPMWVIVEGTRLSSGSLGPLEPSEDLDNPSPPESGAGVGYMPDPRPADTIAVVQIANPYDGLALRQVVDSSGQVRWLPRYKFDSSSGIPALTEHQSPDRGVYRHFVGLSTQGLTPMRSMLDF